MLVITRISIIIGLNLYLVVVLLELATYVGKWNTYNCSAYCVFLSVSISAYAKWKTG